MIRRAALAVVSLGLLWTLPPAVAEEPSTHGQGWSASPATTDGRASNRPYLVYEAAPGDLLRDQVLIRNTGTSPLLLRTYGADAYSDSAGRFTLRTSREEAADVGSWIRLATDETRLAAGAEALVPVRIKVPSDVAPGDHVGGVITAHSRAATDDRGDRVLVETRVAVRVHVRVTGPGRARLASSDLVAEHDSGAWWNPFDDMVRVRYRTANPGDLRLAVRHQVVVRGPLGIELGIRTGQAVPDLLPAADIPVGANTTTGADAGEVSLTAPLGDMDVEVTVQASDRLTGEPLEPQVLTVGVEGTPWVWAWWLALLVGVSVLVVWSVRRVRRQPAREPEGHP